MKVLVTGSNGFVGKALVLALKAKGNFVKEFDLALGNDLLDSKQCEEAAKGIDIVFHLAAVLDEKSKLLKKVNVEGTKNIVEASANARVKQFVFLSTVGVHGKAKEEINEETKIHPETEYEKTKAEAEKIVLEFQEMVPITIIRAALILGPNEYWKSIIKMIQKNLPLPGEGKNTFQTIYIDDLISALVFAMNNENCFGETFIVSEKEKHSLKELVLMIRKDLELEGELKTVSVGTAKTGAVFLGIKNKLSGKKSLYAPEYIDRLQHERNYNTSKIYKLGWRSRYTTEESIKKTIEKIKKEE